MATTAYASDMNGNFAQYFFATANVFVAPVVENATVNTPSQLYGGLAAKTLWVPPGDWLELPTGKIYTGPSVVSKRYDITEIPVFVKAGSMLPTVPLKIVRQPPTTTLSLSALHRPVCPPGAARAS